MKAVFDNLTSGAGRRAQLEYKADSAVHPKADFIKVSVQSMRLSIQMHVTDWAEAQCGDPEIKAAMDWCCLGRRKCQPWAEQLAKLKDQIKEVKCFIIPRAHWRTAIDGCHHDAGHQGKKRKESLISDQFWWPGVFEDVNRAVQDCK